jgi:prephenate dehydrogenase
MDYAAAADALMRRKLLEEMYDRMTDEEKRLFAMMTMQNKSNDEILRAIQQNQQHLERLVEHANSDKWYVAFGSDVAANVLTTSAFWLLGKLFAKR